MSLFTVDTFIESIRVELELLLPRGEAEVRTFRQELLVHIKLESALVVSIATKTVPFRVSNLKGIVACLKRHGKNLFTGHRRIPLGHDRLCSSVVQREGDVLGVIIALDVYFCLIRLIRQVSNVFHSVGNNVLAINALMQDLGGSLRFRLRFGLGFLILFRFFLRGPADDLHSIRRSFVVFQCAAFDLVFPHRFYSGGIAVCSRCIRLVLFTAESSSFVSAIIPHNSALFHSWCYSQTSFFKGRFLV
mmetsp:Transcript_27363/g.75441  ORF Transcript_27363/g.75441 Transcript_27363/m.75441 type:complete len:247 (-) Transcript_27363:2503-3243(-)